MMMLKKDFRTETWDRLAEHMRQRIVALHIELESRANTPESSSAIRGRIGELRDMLRLEKAPAEAPRPGDRFGGQAAEDSRPAGSDDGG